ncbi:hypothetical protein PHYSODRAFT_295265 [Phytophthora sojae]|uniref:Uncharacterized protein n=1 Tax=Phytophthora sojae (strain P6497) TaxID=1094619 RepID=G4YLK4_PHYSP|nr:hypothetical protein PHYSODRAFT_295265 [Phytophthora sojae]EGZ30485.1 hypothetical protein PHYSODRAFT_295265 [Phytophthora sojae]|eukprot:XP_009517760.1 hypothetical protein PHYSODRAFT_295265 [Phytophthora sojae]
MGSAVTGHFIRDCRIYREKQEHGWRHPLPCRTRKDFHDDDRDPTRKRDYQRDEDRKREGDRKRSRDDKESDGRHSRGDKSKFRKRSDGDRAMVSKADNDSRSSSESALMSIDARCYGEDRSQ